MNDKVVELGRSKHPRRFYGQCQRCPRVDYLPWATEHRVRYCGQCWENDALSYVTEREQGPNMIAHDDYTSRRDL